MARTRGNITDIPLSLFAPKNEVKAPALPTNEIFVRDPAVVPALTVDGQALDIRAFIQSLGGDLEGLIPCDGDIEVAKPWREDEINVLGDHGIKP